MMHRKRRSLVRLFSLILATSSSCWAFHTVNRFFPFLESAYEFVPRKHAVQITPFFTSASTAFNSGWGTGRIPELGGSYDLRDIITGLEFVKGDSFVDPIYRELDSSALVKKSMPFIPTGKIRSVGYSVRFEEYFEKAHLTLGCWMPFACVSSSVRYEVNTNKFLEQFAGAAKKDYDNDDTFFGLDRVRRSVHDEIGFTRNLTTQFIMGDLDLYTRWNYSLDHRFLMKSINFAIQAGVLVPVGSKIGVSQRAMPTWVQLMGEGHWGVYFDIAPQFELKHDLKVGLLFGALFQIPQTRVERLSVFKEASIYSPLEALVKNSPGETIKVAPYFILENILDGLHMEVRYNYTRHSQDVIKDMREDQTIPSYLTIKPENFTAITSQSNTVTVDEIKKNIEAKSEKSKWRSHYLTVHFSYDLISEERSWSNQKIYVLYDMPFSGKSIGKDHQVSFGYQAYF